MPLVNRAPIDASGNLLVTTTAPTAAWPSLGGMIYDPVTGALAVIDAVPAVNDPWVGAIRFTNIGQMYVWSAALPAGVEYVGGIPVTDDGRMVVNGAGGGGTVVVGGWPISGSGGVPVTGLAAQPIFFAPLTNSLIPTTAGNPTFTFTRATLAYAMDFEGVLRQGISNEARFQGARRVRNWLSTNSENLTTPTPLTQANVTIAPTTVTFTAVNSAYCYKESSIVTTYYPAGTVVVRAKVACSINRTVCFRVSASSGTATTAIANLALTSTPQIVTLTSVVTGTAQIAFGVENRTAVGATDTSSGGVITFTEIQFEMVDGQSNQAPSEYVSVGVLAAPYHGNAVDGVKYFATRNGNSVPGANLVLQSQTFNVSPWSAPENGTVTPNTQTAPDGTSTADVLTDNATGGMHRIYQLALTLTAAPYTFSLYVKQGTLPWVQILLSDNTTNFWANFNLATGAVGNKHASVTANVVALPNGWYRCSVTATTAVSAGGNVQILCSSIDSATPQPQYVGTGQTMYLWGAQVELGSSASGYNPTTTTTVAGTNVVTEATGAAIPAATMLGYVAENAATNVCLQSQTFDNAGWTKTAATIAADSIAAPDGTLTADRLTDDATNAIHRAFSGTITVTAVPYTFSVYLRAGTLSWAQLVSVSGGEWGNFNIATGALGSKSAGATLSIVALPNGWYRCSITGTGTTFSAQVVAIPSDIATVTPTYVGTGQTMYLWGAQVEQASDPSSYIPTTTVAVTRNIDSLSYQIATNIDGALATTYSECYFPSAFVGSQQFVFEGSPTGYAFHYYDSTKILGNYSAGGPSAFTANQRVIGAINKAASAWSGVTVSTCLNGGAVATGAFAAYSLTSFKIGGLSQPLRGTVRNVKFYATRLTDVEIQGLTA